MTWIEHVKQYQEKHGVSYKQAMTDAKASYTKVKDKQIKGGTQVESASRPYAFEIKTPVKKIQPGIPGGKKTKIGGKTPLDYLIEPTPKQLKLGGILVVGNRGENIETSEAIKGGSSFGSIQYMTPAPYTKPRGKKGGSVIGDVAQTVGAVAHGVADVADFFSGLGKKKNKKKA